MTTSIDLYLVELRCKLRGWKSYRLFAGEDGDTIAVECKYGGLVGFDADGQRTYEEAWNTPAHKRIEALLTAPRWTLERLLSEPPEGWVRQDWRCTEPTIGWLTWGERISDSQHYELTMSVERRAGQLCLFPAIFPGRGPDGLARLAQRHKAAAELALILAEVEP